MVDDLEILERQRTLERKIELISHTAQISLEVLQQLHSYRLEWYIIALIAFEIVLQLYDMFFRALKFKYYINWCDARTISHARNRSRPWPRGRSRMRAWEMRQLEIILALTACQLLHKPSTRFLEAFRRIWRVAFEISGIFERSKFRR